MAEDESWDRMRAAILPNTMIWALFYLFGFFQDELPSIYLWIAIGGILPCAIISLCIYLFTTKTQPPKMLMTIFSILAFLMSVAWINCAANCVVDLLKLFGFITTLP